MPTKKSNVVPIRKRVSVARRNKLVEAAVAAKVVDPIALRVHSRIPPCFELDDLMQAGYLGLIDAASRFNPALHDNFFVYARTRIFGSIIDSIRRKNWYSATTLSLDEGLQVGESINFCTEETSAAWQRQIKDERVDLAADVSQGEMRRKLSGALAILPPKELRVVQIHYGKNVGLREAGKEVGIEASRASQLHRASIKRMRGYFELRGQREMAA